MAGFRSIHFNGVSGDDARLARLNQMTRVARGSGSGAGVDQILDGFQEFGGGAAAAPDPTAAESTAQSEEASARLALQTYLEDAGNESLKMATAPTRPELVPDMTLESTTNCPDIGARSIAYQQSASAIPIFGARVIVDIDASNQSLISINGKVSGPPDGDAVAQMSPAAAWQVLREMPRGDAPDPGTAPPAPPVLTWFLAPPTDRWHLTYHFTAIALAPPPEAPHEDLPFELPDQIACATMCHRSRYYDYFVDAHDGAIRYFFSSSATLDIPAPMKGVDCANLIRDFYGLREASSYLLIDPMRNLETYDYGYQDLAAVPAPPIPASAISNPTNDFGTARPEAVSAHYHAQLVFDFYNDVLKRKGVDDKGMKLVSVVNAYSSDQNPSPPPIWGNAAWFDGRMWYGQSGGTSYAKYLDIIAHELTHGVTQKSSALIYRDLPGALNESFSDIFGIVIANWYPTGPNPFATWNWEIGRGLGAGGSPIRNFAQPELTGQPVHMSQYRPLGTRDNGGVHIYSGIHNRAVYLMMTAKDFMGEDAFPIRELVLLLYWTLTRLTPMSDFLDSRRTLENVVGTHYIDNPSLRAIRLEAVAQAYDAVGIG